MNEQYVTEHFSWNEMTRSAIAARHGIANTPNDTERKNIRMVAQQMEKIRAYASEKRGKDTAIIITSCFRNERVNKLVGGSPTSAHRFGLAVDFVIQGMTSAQAAALVKEMADKGLIIYDQLILEFPKSSGSWVHIGWRDNGAQRGQELTANKVNGKTVYSQGLV